jgi:ABC-type long-subunit fatty acid transport system fused permease/ATPase subunit
MDYKLKEENIIEYVKNNFNSYVEGKPINYFINEFLDFDTYNYDNSIFFEFDNYSYEQISNESQLETLSMAVFIVVRNDIEKNLHENLRDYATSFYKMFEASGCNFKGLFDQGIITDVDFYDAVEGNPSIKLAKINISLFKEI